jgi:hypothetical protein
VRNLQQRLFDAYAVEVRRVSGNDDGIITAARGDVDTSTDGIADNSRLYRHRGRGFHRRSTPIHRRGDSRLMPPRTAGLGAVVRSISNLIKPTSAATASTATTAISTRSGSDRFNVFHPCGRSAQAIRAAFGESTKRFLDVQVRNRSSPYRMSGCLPPIDCTGLRNWLLRVQR